MSITVTVPEGFQYVGVALLTTSFLLLGQNVIVGRYRKRAGIEYPQMYAEKAQAEQSRDAHLFNCAQRAHQNTLEQMPIMFTTSLISGLIYPIPTAVATVLWTVSRISYTRGYVTGDPKKRGSLLYRLGSLVGALGMLFVSTYIAGRWLLQGVKSL